ncbi:unnamed protein product [Bursaphelenchus xylophilus]|uniref:(pine wood nematode) hypothetical protein n=1 Tax=Bursaphelenchus xylophilus TaxID=6326 RepID=A0A1I7SEP1_BURXY|nr:unnamed protein product [Bursaphelenchus xylophilus]CAG9092863.1 unnamed protein product [Bursaphelenchus xylophilus]
MKFDMFLLIAPLLLYGGVIELEVYDSGYVQGCHSFIFGTHRQRPLLDLQLFTADLSLRDFNCDDTYGKCKPLCKQETFCALYCSPMCCVDREAADRVCKAREGYYYQHLSTKFKVLSAYWRSRSNRDGGVWVEDEMQLLDSSYNTVDLGITNFTLQVATAPYLNAEDRPLGEIGFGRDPVGYGFVNVLYKKGIIDQPVLSIGHPHIFDPRYTLGAYNTNDCYDDWQPIPVVGDHGWMFDAQAVAFLNYKSEVHDFRVMLSSDGVARMPRHVFNSFFPSLLSRYRNEYDIYQLNDSRRNDEFDFYVDMLPQILAQDNVSLLQLQILDPNPDRVEWILGRMILLDTCITFDFEKSEMYFAQARPNDDDDDDDSEDDEGNEFRVKKRRRYSPLRRKANNVGHRDGR